MNYSTLAQIKTRLQNECDLFGEDFVEEDTELLGYINAAIDSAKSIIHTLYEDYFLNKTTLTLASGTAAYSCPSDIYAHKIRALVYNNSSTQRVYPIVRIMRLHQAALYGYETSSAYYRYLLTNDATTGVKINIYPTPVESGALVDCWYIRNPKVLSSASDQCDIPEFINFIYAHVKWAISGKERSGFVQATAKDEYLVQKELMEKALADMIPDEESSEIQKDLSFYREFDQADIL